MALEGPSFEGTGRIWVDIMRTRGLSEMSSSLVIGFSLARMGAVRIELLSPSQLYEAYPPMMAGQVPNRADLEAGFIRSRVLV